MSQLKDYTFYGTRQGRRVSKLIKSKRQRLGLTVEQAAEQIGTTRSALYRWENQRLSRTAVQLILWLYDDRNDVLYWRERALAAETALQRVSRAVIEHHTQLADLELDHRPSLPTTVSSSRERARKRDRSSTAKRK